MGKLLTFKCITYDTKTLNPGVENYIFFNEYENIGENEMKMEERLLIKWLISRNTFKELLMNELDLPFDSKSYTHVTKPFIDSPYHKPGDIDLLLIDRDNTSCSIAIECKKVNVKKDSTGNDIVNKIGKIKNAIAQTNGLLAMGFYKVYLTIIIGTYGAEFTEFNSLYRGVDNFQAIYDFPHRDKLDSRVGIMFIQVIQNTFNTIDKTGFLSLCIDTFAKEQEQSKQITEHLKSL